MSPLRVLEVSKSTGGLGTYMRWLAHGLDRSRFDLTFACLSSGATELAAELARLPGTQTLAWPMDRYKIDPFGDAKVIVRLWRLIRTEKFDLVHAHGSKAGFIARVAAIGSGVPVVYSPHNFAFHEGAPRWQRTLYAFVERLAARFLTARIMTVSDAEQALAAQFHVGRPGLFSTVHSGVELDPFRPVADKREGRARLGVPRDAFLVGTVGRLIEQKSPQDFVRVAAKVQQTHPQAHFVWVGDGHLMPIVRDLCNELGLQNMLHFAGHREDVPELLGTLDCFLMTSRWEGFSLALLEAMASRLPVVVTNLPGNAEAVEDGVQGYLLPVGDADGMAAAIGKLIDDPQSAAAMGARGRQRVEAEFTRQHMIDRLMNVYSSVTSRRVM